MSYVAVIGAGSWGTTLAALLADKGYDTTLWTHEAELAQSINAERTNHLFLPGQTLPPLLRATDDLSAALSGARFVLNAVPTQHIRSVFTNTAPLLSPETVLVSAAKGIEITTFKTPSMILAELLGRPVAALSGPSFAKEVLARQPTAVTLATSNVTVGYMLQELFNTDFFRVYTHDDVIGVEIGGALKNVIAIASGISDGLGLGHNARAALITRGLSEIKRLGAAFGTRDITFSGLSGIGDLLLTCTALLSRNYSVGFKLGQGLSLTEITSQSKSVAEGVPTALAAHQFARTNTIEMPITEQVYLTLYEGKLPADAVRDLMTRSLRAEFDG
ncbi:MAG TPA: NAD(P)H-dependent glycerol-3-phosphate dehydrogenase [Dissulfurispiraceae bacterium]|nr:NAD(P)H-dependent glycerol-3-phosphate dehydrogenase [Dissulfurispiraceae bacterium]